MDENENVEKWLEHFNLTKTFLQSSFESYFKVSIMIVNMINKLQSALKIILEISPEMLEITKSIQYELGKAKEDGENAVSFSNSLQQLTKKMLKVENEDKTKIN